MARPPPSGSHRIEVTELVGVQPSQGDRIGDTDQSGGVEIGPAFVGSRHPGLDQPGHE